MINPHTMIQSTFILSNLTLHVAVFEACDSVVLEFLSNLSSGTIKQTIHLTLNVGAKTNIQILTTEMIKFKKLTCHFMKMTTVLVYVETAPPRG